MQEAIEKLQMTVQKIMKTITLNMGFDVRDELLFQVIGAELFGFATNFGRINLFLNQVQINKVLVGSLVEIGAAEKYTKGMIEHFDLFSRGKQQA